MALSLDELGSILNKRSYEQDERKKLQDQLVTSEKNVKRLLEEIAIKDLEIGRLEARARALMEKRYDKEE